MADAAVVALKRGPLRQTSREAIAARFAGANLYLGNVVGEFIGELSLNAFFLVASLALARAASSRVVCAGSGLAANVGWTAMLRNITPAVSTIASINNGVLPLWMLALGGALIVTASRRSDQAPGWQPRQACCVITLTRAAPGHADAGNDR